MGDSPRFVSAQEAAGLVRAKDTLAVPLGPGQPSDFLKALGAEDRFEDLTVSTALLTDLFELFMRPGVRLLTGFYGPAERFLRGAGHDVQFVPGDFRRFGVILERLHPRVMATAASRPDEKGRLSLSLHAGATVTELERCGRDPDRLLIVEASPRFPRTVGIEPDSPHCLRMEDVDILIESESEPFTLQDPAPTEVDAAIAKHVARFVSDGCTLQTGIGGVPSLVVGRLADGNGGDYGIHSEMFTSGLMKLHRAGKVTNQKGLYDGVSVCTFAAGTRELYDWLDGNEDVRFLPVERVNDPGLIGRNRKMISINGALAVDLAGQVAADTLAGGQFSGIGGHEDFVEGTGQSLQNRSLVCLPSSSVRDGKRISRIDAALGTEMLVTTPRHQVDAIITEFGAAELFGRTVQERADALTSIAHPEFRDELRRATLFS
ncbi:MAG: acetyl-CoA hydrolase/transferase C-terminal domain-containing protein [Candidatus Binatia bacterium]|nr:acetyl-CoA hydrolase/transferase C-terminal domain-containing protein [Candidatus Binatia bacterium]